MRTKNVRFAAVLLFGAAGDPAIGQEAIDMKLADAGFIMRPADTPEKVARLKLLPPRKFVRRKTGAGHYYIYADPHYCKCALVGSERAMQTYRAMVKPLAEMPTISVPPSGTTPEHEESRDLNADLGEVPAHDIFHFKF
jgi:hypothetical protein